MILYNPTRIYHLPIELLEYILYNSGTITQAAQGGNLEIVKYLYELGCPWNKLTFAWGTQSGNIDMLTWMDKKGCLISLETYAWAANGIN